MSAWPCLAAVLATAACAGYQAEPTAAAGMQQRLSAPDYAALRIEAGKLHHPLLPAITLDPSDGVSPDEAAVLAVLLNPSLRAARHRRSIAEAQLVAAGILPNPELTGAVDVPVGKNPEG